MLKSDNQIIDDVYRHLMRLKMNDLVSGRLCKRERMGEPGDEDVIILVIAQGMVDDVQEAAVNVNIYVRDILVEGQWVLNKRRIDELEPMAKEMLKLGGLGEDYSFYLEKQETFRNRDFDNPHEHYISNRLTYRTLKED